MIGCGEFLPHIEGFDEIKMLSPTVTEKDARYIASEYGHVQEDHILLVDIFQHDLSGDNTSKPGWAVIEDLGVALQVTWIDPENGEIIDQVEPYLFIIDYVTELRSIQENSKTPQLDPLEFDDCGD